MHFSSGHAGPRAETWEVSLVALCSHVSIILSTWLLFIWEQSTGTSGTLPVAHIKEYDQHIHFRLFPSEGLSFSLVLILPALLAKPFYYSTTFV